MASDHETIFTMEATPVKFGSGASADAGWELKRLGVKRVMMVTDPGVAALGHPERIKGLIEDEGIEVIVYDRARVEPTIDSLQDAADFAIEHEVDGFVSVGGGSSMDTAKVANLGLDPPGAGDGLRQPTGGRGQETALAAEASPRDPDHVGDGVRGHDGRGPRHPRHQGQDRDLAPIPARHAGARRSRADPLACHRGDVLDRARRRLPRRGVVPLKAVRHARRALRVRTSGRPTRAQTRSPTCGRPRRSSSAVAICVAPSPTVTTSKRAAS